MIKNILIPEKIGSYYIFPTRVLGFDINKTQVHAVQLYLTGKQVVIEQFFSQNIELNASVPAIERISNAIAAISTKVKKPFIIHSALSSGLVVFKELELPFTQEDKIRQVLGFELESSLPFSLSQAVIDFIVLTKTENKTTILAVAAQKQSLAEHISYFSKCDEQPKRLLIDILSLYGLYSTIPAYSNLSGTRVLLDCGLHVTRIVFIHDGRLRFLRTLNQGLYQIAKELGAPEGISSDQAMEKLIRFGLKSDSTENTKNIKQAFDLWWSHVQLTLSSFASQAGVSTIDQVLILGEAAEISDMPSYLKNLSGIDCQLFEITSLIQTSLVTMKARHFSSNQIMSLAAAYPSTINQSFNLLQEEFDQTDATLFVKQFGTALALALMTIGLLIFHNYRQISSLKKSVTEAERTVVRYLKNEELADAKSLKEAVEQASEKVQSEEDIWFAFSGQTRFSFLNYLQALSTSIDRDAIGLKLKRLLITESAITVDGEVKNFEALRLFEKELKRSELFVSVPTLQETKFSITLPIKKPAERT